MINGFEIVNDAELDWPNIAEEIEDVGRSQLQAVESLLFQALVHMLKARAWPLARDAGNWQADARGFLVQARRRFAPSPCARSSIYPGCTPMP